MKVDFIIVGAQKCGTSTLYSLLDSHPKIIGSNPKETNFFSTFENWQERLSCYHNCFKRDSECLYFEASPSYTNHPIEGPGVWEKIQQYNPGMKIVYIVRNPIDRIISAYMHLFRRGYTDLDIENAVFHKSSIINRTQYYRQIRPYIDTFGKENIYICHLEDLIKLPGAFLQNITRFLGVDYNVIPNTGMIHRNKSLGKALRLYKYDGDSIVINLIKMILPESTYKSLLYDSDRIFIAKPNLSIKAKENILEVLEPDICRFEKLTGRNLNEWRVIK